MISPCVLLFEDSESNLCPSNFFRLIFRHTTMIAMVIKSSATDNVTSTAIVVASDISIPIKTKVGTLNFRIRSYSKVKGIFRKSST